jgi:putative transposase
MQRTLKIPVNVGKHKSALLATLETAAKVYNDHTEFGFTNREWSKKKMHHQLYTASRSKYLNFPSALVQTSRDNACESLKSMNSNGKWKRQPKKKKYGSLRYDQRTFSIDFEKGLAYITVMGPERITVSFALPAYYLKYLNWKVCGMQLVYRKNSGQFYLHVTMEQAAPEPTKGTNTLGIDKGLTNFLYLSNGICIIGDILRNMREYYRQRRRELQKIGTYSAKRKLRLLSGKEKRFVTDFLHCTVNQLLRLPYDIYVIEDLTGIRERGYKKLRRLVANWVYRKLDEILSYKALGLGKIIHYIDPAYTSQTCSACGHVKKANRKGEQFKCRACNFETHADYNASLNIVAAAVNQPNGLAMA